MPLILSIRSNLNLAIRDLDRLERQQIPFASALAVNNLAALIQKAATKEIKETFPTATPFTLNSVRGSRARKSDPTATIFPGQIAEQYLAPYIIGGRHFLGSKRGILNPKNVNVNQYGNIAKGRLAALKARGDVFIGQIKTKDGKTINGVFQRGNFVKKARGRAGQTKGVKAIRQKHRLKILIRFGDSLQVHQHLDWFGIAGQVLAANAQSEMDKAFQVAISTARPSP